MSEVRYVTLISDFGTEDGYVGAMKGIILNGASHARVVDVSHDIEAFNIRQAAFAVKNAAGHFPPGTIHIVVVDPGVGTARKPLVVQTSEYFFIGPDNGVFSFIYAQEGYQAFEIKPQVFGHPISSTFHGRDIFAPAAVKLLTAEPLSKFCEPAGEVVSFFEPLEKISDNEYELRVIHVDHFGNLILNLNREVWQRMAGNRTARIKLDRGFLVGIQDTFGSAPKGRLLILWDSSGYLQIAQNHGNASESLQIKTGHKLTLQLIDDEKV
ncbi:MAG: SAM-dependent chlorinase/fluorinase [Calditrichia bacterium]